MSESDPVKWIQDVLGTELWETQKHIIAAMDESPAPVEATHGVEARRRLLDRWATILVRTNPVYPHCDPISDIHHWNELFNQDPRPVKHFWMSNGLLKTLYEAWEAGSLKRKTIHYGPRGRVGVGDIYVGVDPAGNQIDSSVCVIRGEDGTFYHEGKDFSIKDGVLTALPGGRLWDGRHKTVSIGYTVVCDEAADWAAKTPFTRDQVAGARDALRTKRKPAEKRPPLHKPQPWNPPVARRRKR